MARNNAAAETAANTANSNSQVFGGNAGALYGAVAPQLEAEAANPTGYNPADLAAMTTQAEQGAGGSQAAAVGQGALLSGRTRNAGSAAKAVADASRGAGERLSEANLGVQAGNARLREQQRQAALSGLTGLTGMETGASNAALGEVAPNVNANVNQQNESWNGVKDLLDPALGALQVKA